MRGCIAQRDQGFLICGGVLFQAVLMLVQELLDEKAPYLVCKSVPSGDQPVAWSQLSSPANVQSIRD